MQGSIEKLIKLYEINRRKYRSADSSFGEADTRTDFIDPLFQILGWDITNERGLSYRLREVIREESIPVDEHIKRPDYVFKLGPERRFFVEAKSPGVDIVHNPASAFQTRRYGWSANLRISVLTNFENLAIYDTTTKPSPDHPANHSRLYLFSYDEYLEYLDEIAGILSRDAVYGGEFDDRFSDEIEQRPAESIDSFFLQLLNKWRLQLGQEILKRRPGINVNLMNETVQRLMLRILFLRMCEDRGIETYKQLKGVTKSRDWSEFMALIRRSNQKFDSRLFSIVHDPFFEVAGTPLRLDPSLIDDIVEGLYYPQAPYTFSVLDSEFLGSVYEQFLVERLDLADGEVRLKKKPENEDRDIVPTPRPLIRRIVRETLGPFVKDATVEEIMDLRIVDPSCGSGGFLVAAFDILIDRAVEAYANEGDNEAVYETANGKHLAFDKKHRILTQCLFGVDRDFSAVEVSKFSLLVKLLERESRSTLPEALPILPALDENIVLGDSLVDQRVYEEDPRPDLIGPPLTWGEDIEVPFSIVVGNPPYMSTETMVNSEPTEYQFYQRYYDSAYRQFDKYYLFIERALERLMDEDALLGMVVSRKFSHIESGKKIRRLISKGRHLVRLVDFGTAQLFGGRTTYTCLLFLSKSAVPKPEGPCAEDTFIYELVTTPQEWLAGLVNENSNRMELPRELVQGDNAWLLPSTSKELELIQALLQETVPLGQLFDVFNGIQTSRKPVYEITKWKRVDEQTISFEVGEKEWVIEEQILRSFFDDDYGKLHSFHPMPETVRIIFPYFVDEQQNGDLRATVISPDMMRERFPGAYAWLRYNRDTLRDRAISPANYPPDEWYRYGRTQNLTAFDDRTKIVVGINSLGDKYVYDDSDTLLASGGTAGECAIAHFRDPASQSLYDLHFILAILNHKAIEYYCRKRGSPFRGGWYSRGTAVLKTVPVPDIDFEHPESARTKLYSRITSSCRRICQLYASVDSATSEEQRVRIKREAWNIKRLMDRDIADLYDVAGVVEEVELPR